MIALRESDIDWFNVTFKVSKSRVRGLEKKVTKTHTSREVYLNERSTLALKSLIQFKKDLGYTSDYLMLCPQTKEPFFNEKPPRERLRAAMKFAIGLPTMHGIPMQRCYLWMASIQCL